MFPNTNHITVGSPECADLSKGVLSQSPFTYLNSQYRKWPQLNSLYANRLQQVNPPDDSTEQPKEDRNIMTSFDTVVPEADTETKADMGFNFFQGVSRAEPSRRMWDGPGSPWWKYFVRLVADPSRTGWGETRAEISIMLESRISLLAGESCLLGQRVCISS
ncbi:hypothetical protein SODALDRAFT_358943 [Sodiomyces alkalinus F11]|uniref:Uncharacterized protein n=1 Tax=Sodiomyces alkalinus (strain CBS 110278 / VKM F-3762 / F11) TaxID=1314773 RepID=A0A3N2PX26_SODAK|nr:hypothetical protein SODALDRAFT_358943 [Sodiomyces alkalinus F11]ROT39083.1 hypothetical protein SODALDRAFT_358943 [Sodiomyces alkalinus F11]